MSDIKTTLLTTITNSDLKETARGAIKYRKIIDFVFGISIESNPNDILLSKMSFEEVSGFLKKLKSKNNSLAKPVVAVEQKMLVQWLLVTIAEVQVMCVK